ncbi:MAG: hypothetical protein ACI92G_004057 [Candidatus Pelagisphaera sp.]
MGERGPAQNITVEDCFVHDGLDAKNWGTKMWMNRHNGMYQGRHGTKLTFRNNFVLNTRFGIELASTESLCQGNVISDFSGDGIRVMRDGITVEHNVIRNVYVGSGDGNQNRGFDGRSAATTNPAQVPPPNPAPPSPQSYSQVFSHPISKHK